MQNSVLLAFRKRCKNRGYTNIHITKFNETTYVVSAVEPLSKTTVQAIYDISTFNSLFR